MSDNINTVEAPKLMWSPDRQQCTKMDELRKIINAKYNVKLGMLK